jgi:hypothetical protein
MRFALLAFATAVVACTPDVTSVPSRASQNLCPPSSETERIFQGLKPHCEGCHVSGELGYFANAGAFDTLLARDPRYVVAGDGANSVLVKLLRGTARGAFAQMPIGERSYADLVQSGDAALPIEDVETWIGGLTNVGRDASPNPDLVTIRRIDADRILTSLSQHLGLGYDDFFVTSQNFQIPTAAAGSTDTYAFHSPDGYPGSHYGFEDDHHFGLGGGSVVAQTGIDNSPSPTFINTLIPVVQAWCKKSILKSDSVLFVGQSRDTESANATAVLTLWSKRFHGEPLPRADIDDLASSVVLPLASDPNVAWSAGCAALLRHPKFLFY